MGLIIKYSKKAKYKHRQAKKSIKNREYLQRKMKDLIIGVDVGGTNLRCALISRAKGIVAYEKEKIKNINSKERILKQLTTLIDKQFSSKIRGIGIGVPGIVDLKKGILYEAFNLLAWDKVPIKSILEKRYNVPVSVNNDAKCFALGEKHFGAARKYKDVVGIILGTGFGAGIIIDNKIYCGKNCAAGEFGRVLLKDKTIEDYCSGKFFISKYRYSGKELYEMAKKHDKKALRAFKEFGENLGLGLSVVINSIDPEIIVLGGSVSEGFEFFKKPLLTSLKKHIYKQVYKNIKIVKADNIEKAGVLGAASLFLEN